MSDKLVSITQGKRTLIHCLMLTLFPLLTSSSTSKEELLTYLELKKKAPLSSGTHHHRIMGRKDTHWRVWIIVPIASVNPPYGRLECHFFKYQRRVTVWGKFLNLIHVCCHGVWESQESWHWGEWVWQQRQKVSPGKNCLINHRLSEPFSRTSLRGLNDPPQQC